MTSSTQVVTTALVLLGHGSRDPLWRGPIEHLANRISQLSPAVAVRCAYLEWSSPDMTTAVEELIALGHSRIRLLPLFFGMGKHAREDLPELVQTLRTRHPALELQVLPSAGEQSTVIELLAQLALQE
jgi:sirohydrochlorin cobaltochelatase